MNEQQKNKVIIVGAGPVGSYLAGILGKKGINVEVYEQREKQHIREELGLIHFDVHSYTDLGLPRPSHESGIVANVFKKMWQIPKSEELKFAVPYETDIVYMNPFNQWIIDYADKNKSVSFHFGHKVKEAIIEEDSVVGVLLENNVSQRAKLVIDATGRFATIRNSLPKKMGLKPLKTRKNRMFTVYMQKWECDGEFPKGSNTYVCYKGFANQCGKKQTLVGASTLLGLENTKKHHRDFVNYHLSDVEHKIVEEFWDQVPYDFPPSSMVANGFLTVGDSAFQNKPFNGEGMSSGMEAAQIAMPTIIKSLKTDKMIAVKDDLWPYNVDYFRDIGAKFATIRGAGETLVDLSPDDFNWMYNSEFLTKKDMLDTWTKYEVKKGPFSIMKALYRGFSNLPVFKKVLGGLILGAKLHRLYEKYPENPGGLHAWERKFERLIPKK